ncbi:MAG: GntR family transcriptional regulator [Ideonella sp.]
MLDALPLPKYHQIYLVLRQQLDEGRYEAGFPSELALTKEFCVARVTVRKALERLVTEGRIVRTPGRGTTRAGSPAPRNVRGAKPAAHPALNGLLKSIVSAGLRTSVKVVECRLLNAPELVAQALQLASDARVQKAVRVRSTRGGAVSHITTWVPEAAARGFGKRELSRQPILLLLEAAGVRIGRSTQQLSACLADATISRYLGVEVGSALLAVSRLVMDADERPVQWLHGLYRPDRYRYEMQLSRVGEIDAQVWVGKELQEPFH